MFIKKLSIQNFRLFPADKEFVVDDINVPDNSNDGSGLTVFVGENGCGKTSLLDAISLPLLEYKTENFSIQDFFNPNKKTNIEILSEKNFEVSGTMPRGKFYSKGFSFEANVRSRDNKTYLSSLVVNDQKFIKADGCDKPKDSSPDLRVNVNNPFKGKRFDENDILFLDKNRIYQIRSGTYNTTRFDRLMEDLSLQYIRSKDNIDDLSGGLDGLKNDVENQFLADAITKFEKISNAKITLNFIENWHPFKQCFFAEKKDNSQQISLDMLGAGYEMIFALIYSFYLAQQSGKQLIVLIDEPELHLHPSLQEKFVKLLLEFSKTAQIIITTHSPLLVKQLFYNENIDAKVLSKNGKQVKVVSVEERLLPFISSSEVNYLAFGLATEEHHNELYEELKYKKADDKGIKKFDSIYFQTEKNEPANYPWRGNQNKVSLHTYIRNQIHHFKDNGCPDLQQLTSSIETMRKYLKELI
jgi:predicted ATP-dependent endonuclease of OLD family